MIQSAFPDKPFVYGAGKEIGTQSNGGTEKSFVSVPPPL
jgi:hypothetical protein